MVRHRLVLLLWLLTWAIGPAPSASASPLDITSIIGQWQNPTGPFTFLENQAGQAVDRIRWGWDIVGESDGSGYDFVPGSSLIGVSVGIPFVLGTFTHHNQTIPLGTAISAVQYAFEFTTNGAPGPIGTVLNFFHNETPNVPPPSCPAGTIGPGAPTSSRLAPPV